MIPKDEQFVKTLITEHLNNLVSKYTLGIPVKITKKLKVCGYMYDPSTELFNREWNTEDTEIETQLFLTFYHNPKYDELKVGDIWLCSLDINTYRNDDGVMVWEVHPLEKVTPKVRK